MALAVIEALLTRSIEGERMRETSSVIEQNIQTEQVRSLIKDIIRLPSLIQLCHTCNRELDKARSNFRYSYHHQWICESCADQKPLLIGKKHGSCAIPPVEISEEPRPDDNDGEAVLTGMFQVAAGKHVFRHRLKGLFFVRSSSCHISFSFLRNEPGSFRASLDVKRRLGEQNYARIARAYAMKKKWVIPKHHHSHK